MRATDRISPRAWGWIGPIGVALLAFVLRVWDVAQPRILMFDETYYAKDAWSLLQHGYVQDFADQANDQIARGDLTNLMTGEPSWVVHPEGGRLLIAMGEQLFGLDAFGWRISAVVVGSLTVLLLARLVRRLTGSTDLRLLRRPVAGLRRGPLRAVPTGPARRVPRLLDPRRRGVPGGRSRPGDARATGSAAGSVRGSWPLGCSSAWPAPRSGAGCTRWPRSDCWSWSGRSWRAGTAGRPCCAPAHRRSPRSWSLPARSTCSRGPAGSSTTRRTRPASATATAPTPTRGAPTSTVRPRASSARRAMPCGRCGTSTS